MYASLTSVIYVAATFLLTAAAPEALSVFLISLVVLSDEGLQEPAGARKLRSRSLQGMVRLTLFSADNIN
jgi:hypothetical protein